MQVRAARLRLVGRSFEVNGNIYPRLMIEIRFGGDRTRLTGLHFFFILLKAASLPGTENNNK